jgi:hypothetical protein
MFKLLHRKTVYFKMNVTDCGFSDLGISVYVMRISSIQKSVFQHYRYLVYKIYLDL